MASTLLKTVAGNTAPDIEITCERDGAAIDLTGVSSAHLIIAKGATITQTSRAATIATPSEGIITYTPLSTDFPTVGTYKADVKLTYADATIEILYEQLRMKARAPIS